MKRAALLTALFCAPSLVFGGVYEMGHPSRQPFATWAYGYGALSQDRRHVAVYVSAQESRRIRAGSAAEIRVGEEAADAPPVAGRVVDLLPDADPRTGLAIATIEIPAQGSAPRTYASARIEVSARVALAVPTTAVIRRDGHAFVYRRKGDDDFETVAVETGQAGTDYTEVLAGVAPSDTILVQGALEWENRGAAGDDD